MHESSHPTPAKLYEIVSSGGETGKLIGQHDWNGSLLGASQTWPESLLTSLSICLNSRFALAVLWGPDLVMLYNDRYVPIMGNKHPNALGKPCKEIFAEIWDVVGPMLQGVFATGQAVLATDLLLPLERDGYLEECYFTFSYSSIRNGLGALEGVLSTAIETTEQVLSARRLKTLHALNSDVSKIQSIEDFCQTAMASLSQNLFDIPFALLYRIDAAQQQAQLVGTSGIEPDTKVSPVLLNSQQQAWPLHEMIKARQPILVEELSTRFNSLPTGAWLTAPTTALLLPIFESSGDALNAVLIVAINPRRKLDNAYSEFFKLLARQLGAILSDTLAYEAERRRAEALAEIDRAKTVFFSNISHEFRTPLTLILAPLEDILANTHLPLELQDRLSLMRRNAQRLLKLVNTLLSFSRIDANKMQALYEPTDLAQLTMDLSSVFRSAFEKAKVTLTVHTQALGEPVYVDKGMWEKILFNLLSNALKFTLQGEVIVTLTKHQDQAVLMVQDTGVGIPKSELTHVFERFHRIEKRQVRSHEGTGIGLALTQELVKLHAGSMTLDSEIDKGSTFTVKIPLGIAHLPKNQLALQGENYQADNSGAPIIAESLGWLPDTPFETPTAPKANSVELEPQEQSNSRILIVDDNADMRHYIKSLLDPFWQVAVANDGRAALEILQTQHPDLIISDVMMPNLNGLELLAALRNNANTQMIPVILLSARAGEEIKVEGLQAGADDYLVKPFAAKELLARVKKQLDQVEQRRHTQEQLRMQSALENAQKHKKLQEEFIDTVCHEIRNPLNGIYGCLDELTDILTQLTALKEECHSTLSWERVAHLNELLVNLTHIQTSLSTCADQQKIIVNDVLDLSKLENDKLALCTEVFNPRQGLLNVIQMFQLQLKQKRLKFHFELAEDFYVEIDGNRFNQIITNLVANAIKFTQQGSITLRLTQQPLSDREVQIVVSVSDTGIGMTADEVEQLFQPFVQASTKIALDYGGTGLGLTISKKLITMMGGHIAVNSQKGKGTEFCVTLRAAPAKRPVIKVQSPHSSGSDRAFISKHVLIVEDNVINQKVLANHLKKAGHTYQIANNGLEAANLYKKVDDISFDIILMDVEMPVMDGLEAARQIRHYEKQYQLSPVTIIGLSGNARTEQQEIAFQAGMTDYITKPYHKDELLSRLNQQRTPKLPFKSGLFKASHTVDDVTRYLNDFQQMAEQLIEQQYPFTIQSQANQLTITLLSQEANIPTYCCKLILKELKHNLQNVFKLLNFKHIELAQTCLQIKMATQQQTTLIQTVLEKTLAKHVVQPLQFH